jgi:hypothetical protein
MGPSLTIKLATSTSQNIGYISSNYANSKTTYNLDKKCMSVLKTF